MIPDLHQPASRQPDRLHRSTSPGPESKDLRPLGTAPAILLSVGAALDWSIPMGAINLPIATLLMSLALIWLLATSKAKNLPTASWSYCAILCLLASGFIGASNVPIGTLLRELIQFLEIFVLAVAAGGMLKHTRDWLTGACVGLMIILSANLVQITGLPITGMSLSRSAILAAVLLPFGLEAIAKRQQRANWHVAIASILAVGLTVLAGAPILLTDGSVALLLPLVAATIVCGSCGNKPALLGAVPAAAILLILTAQVHGTSAGSRFHGKFNADYHTRLALEAEAAATSPIVAPFGHGPGHYREAINPLRDTIPNKPHPTDNKVPRDSNSQYLVTLVENGPIAAFALAFLLFSVLWPARFGEGDSPRSLPAAAAGLIVGALFTTILGRGIGIACGVIIGMSLSLPPLNLRQPKSVAPGMLAGIGILSAIILAFALPNLGTQISTIAKLGKEQPPPPRVARSGTSAPQGITLKLEGENYSNATGGFMRVAANDASENAVLVLPDGAGKASGHAIYEIDVPEAGAWMLKARVFWTDGCSNSLGFEFDTQTYRVSSELFNRWHVLQTTRPLRLPSGKVNIRVRNVEDGVRLDWFELSKAE